MITLGFATGISGVVTLDSPLTDGNNVNVMSTYLIIPTGGTEGGIVYLNSSGVAMWAPYAFVGYNPIAASQVVTSAVVGGVTRTTTATPLYFAGSYKG